MRQAGLDGQAKDAAAITGQALEAGLAPRALVVSRGTVGHAGPLTRAHAALRSMPAVQDVATIVAGDVLVLALFD